VTQPRSNCFLGRESVRRSRDGAGVANVEVRHDPVDHVGSILRRLWACRRSGRVTGILANSSAAVSPRLKSFGRSAISTFSSEIAYAVSRSAVFARRRRYGPGEAPQLTAFFTSAAIFFSSAAVGFFSAQEVGHMAPLSRFALSLKPNVAYLALNLSALWK
jgi:hypothetical protein